MNIQGAGVQDVLSQIRALQARSGEGTAKTAADSASSEVNFADTLGSAINSVNATQKSAESVSTAFVQGSKDVELADVMLALNKADVSFKTLAEVRNRMVSAYQDIMNMPV